MLKGIYFDCHQEMPKKEQNSVFCGFLSVISAQKSTCGVNQRLLPSCAAKSGWFGWAVALKVG
jgi:hypothetical protein